MDLMQAMEIASKGMRAQGMRMRVISENVANASTTAKSPDELPYQRQLITFKNVMDRQAGIRHVEVDEIYREANPDFGLKYDPNHPAADDRGYIKTPNVNGLVEMMDMREAQRSYEANLGIIDMTRSMLNRAIDLLRN